MQFNEGWYIDHHLNWSTSLKAPRLQQPGCPNTHRSRRRFYSGLAACGTPEHFHLWLSHICRNHQLTHPGVHDEFPFCGVAEVDSCVVGCVERLVGDRASLQRKYNDPASLQKNTHFLTRIFCTVLVNIGKDFHLFNSSWTVLQLGVVGHDVLVFFSLKSMCQQPSNQSLGCWKPISRELQLTSQVVENI